MKDVHAAEIYFLKSKRWHSFCISKELHLPKNTQPFQHLCYLISWRSFSKKKVEGLFKRKNSPSVGRKFWFFPKPQSIWSLRHSQVTPQKTHISSHGLKNLFKKSGVNMFQHVNLFASSWWVANMKINYWDHQTCKIGPCRSISPVWRRQKLSDCWWFRNPANQSRWHRIFSINRRKGVFS